MHDPYQPLRELEDRKYEGEPEKPKCEYCLDVCIFTANDADYIVDYQSTRREYVCKNELEHLAKEFQFDLLNLIGEKICSSEHIYRHLKTGEYMYYNSKTKESKIL